MPCSERAQGNESDEEENRRRCHHAARSLARLFMKALEETCDGLVEQVSWEREGMAFQVIRWWFYGGRSGFEQKSHHMGEEAWCQFLRDILSLLVRPEG